MSHFFAYLARMKFIQRWGLMRNTHPENIQEHSFQVAMIAHGLGIIKNKLFDGQVDQERIAILALYHDVGEVITGDLATPIKNFNPKIKTAYDEIDVIARQRLFDMVQEELKSDYQSLLFSEERDGKHWELVKAADRICGYLKCVEELKAGNKEFSKAAKAIKADIERLNFPEISYFMEVYVPSFALTLDEMD